MTIVIFLPSTGLVTILLEMLIYSMRMNLSSLAPWSFKWMSQIEKMCLTIV